MISKCYKLQRTTNIYLRLAPQPGRRTVEEISRLIRLFVIHGDSQVVFLESDRRSALRLTSGLTLIDFLLFFC